MDLSLYIRVLRRFKFMVLGGLTLAIVLAFFSVETVSFANGFSPRKGETWQASSMLLVTEPGFAWGQATAPYTRGNTKVGTPSLPKADPQRLSSLTALYAELASSDAVLGPLHVHPKHPQLGMVTVTAVPGPQYSTPAIQPLLNFAATAPSAARATSLAHRASESFRAWLEKQQTAAHTPASARVLVLPVNQVAPPVLVSHTSKTLPIIVFISMMAVTIGLAILLENLRPRLPRLEDHELVRLEDRERQRQPKPPVASARQSI